MAAAKSSSAHATHTLYENLMKALRNEPERRTKVELVEVERSHNIFCDAVSPPLGSGGERSGSTSACLAAAS